ncbi:MAG TPA: class I SAM-dependent methyltransferase [Candidatus Absconditabacterales bacterium]|nr:class I SAM-dependent methyltransferase [Candidatus Absconditabacterales bacterium]
MFKLITAIIILITVIVVGISFLYFIIKSLILPQKQAPYVGSFKRHLKIMTKLNLKKGSTMLDLGCGDGKVLRFFQKTYNLKKCIGYDINPYATIRGKILNKLKGHKNIKIYKKNFLDAKLKGYDYIYTYLRPSQLADIENRLRKNKDKSTIIISNSFEYSKHKPFKILKDKKGKEIIFLYK